MGAFPNPIAGSAAGAAPLPPLPDLSTNPGGTPSAAPPDGLAAILASVMPVKQAVDQIAAACQIIAANLPGSEQKCAMLTAAAQEFLPMAAQTALAPMGAAGGMGMGAGSAAPGPIAPPPGAPPQPVSL